ncbi:MAG: YkoF family thiamine/hydroxymethylpyrimidine-binding protein [Saprospiraceae bacterium]
MQASVEISMYPLTKDYETPILDFIKRMNTYEGLKIETNKLSTQVFGDYDQIMAALQQEMKTSFEQDSTVIMVMKVLNVSP